MITGTCRLIFDTNQKLPIDKRYSLDVFRDQYYPIAEVSRFIIKHQTIGLNQEFKLLIKGIYSVGYDNGISNIISVIKKEHFKLYQKFGGFTIKYRFLNYGEIDQDIVMTSWHILKISNFFKRAFLKESKVA